MVKEILEKQSFVLVDLCLEDGGVESAFYYNGSHSRCDQCVKRG
jgi:hypothetical protein